MDFLFKLWAENPMIQVIAGVDAALLLLVLFTWLRLFVGWLFDKPWRGWFYKPKPFHGNACQIFCRPVRLHEQIWTSRKTR